MEEKTTSFSQGLDSSSPQPFSTSSASTLNSPQDSRPHHDDPEGGVDVARAKEEFAQLGRTLTRQSSLHQTQSREGRDVEKDAAESEFDLLEVMRGDKDARDAEGMKAKRVGVTWNDLKVVGGGGMKIHVRVFPDAIVEQFLLPVLSLLGTFG